MKKFEIGAAIVLGLLVGTVQAEPVQWQVADGGNGHWYEQIDTNSITWEVAFDMAESMGGHLVTLTSEEEDSFVSSSFDCSDISWAGGINLNGEWDWITGEAWDYTNWTPGEPNGGDGAHIEVFFSNCRWNDRVSGTTRPSLIIEWNHDPSITQWRIEDGGNGHWYQLVESGKGFLWSEAVAEAESRGGYLVSLTSADEDAWVYANFDADNRWIGVFQDTNAEDYSEPSGGWQWLSGETSDYSNWNGGGPDNGGVVDAPAEEYAHYCCGGAWNDIYGVDNFGVSVRKHMMVEFTTLPGSALGACCLDGLCITTAAADCSGNSGSWGGSNSSCADFDCQANCPSDINGSGEVDIDDLLALISAFGVCP
jgi:hypothetical protein